jgi:hypothetical protein
LEVKTLLAECVVEWTEPWKQQGLREGLQRGKVAVLERQFARKFGPLGEATRARLRGASLDQLETWADRILDAPSLDAVLEGH